MLWKLLLKFKVGPWPLWFSGILDHMIWGTSREDSLVSHDNGNQGSKFTVLGGGGREAGREGGRDMPVINLVPSLCWRRPGDMFTNFPMSVEAIITLFHVWHIVA